MSLDREVVEKARLSLKFSARFPLNINNKYLEILFPCNIYVNVSHFRVADSAVLEHDAPPSRCLQRNR